MQVKSCIQGDIIHICKHGYCQKIKEKKCCWKCGKRGDPEHWLWRGCEKNLSFIWLSFCPWFSLLVTSRKISCELPYCQEGRPHEAAWSEVVHSLSQKRDSSPQMKGRGLQGQLKIGGETKFLPPIGAHPGQIKRWKPNHGQVRIHHRILWTGSVFFAYWELTKNPCEKKDRREIRVKENVNYKLAVACQLHIGTCQEHLPGTE